MVVCTQGTPALVTFNIISGSKDRRQHICHVFIRATYQSEKVQEYVENTSALRASDML